MSSKKLYQNVNVKKNHKKGNQNINSINIILNPNGNGEDEMYNQGAPQRPSSNDSIYNIMSQPQQPVNPSSMGQILGRANREEPTTTAEEVEEANKKEQVGQMIDEAQVQISNEEQMEQQAIQNAQLRENIEDVSNTIRGSSEIAQQEQATVNAMLNDFGSDLETVNERLNILQQTRQLADANDDAFHSSIRTENEAYRIQLGKAMKAELDGMRERMLEDLSRHNYLLSQYPSEAELNAEDDLGNDVIELLGDYINTVEDYVETVSPEKGFVTPSAVIGTPVNPQQVVTPVNPGKQPLSVVDKDTRIPFLAPGAFQNNQAERDAQDREAYLARNSPNN